MDGNSVPGCPDRCSAPSDNSDEYENAEANVSLIALFALRHLLLPLFTAWLSSHCYLFVVVVILRLQWLRLAVSCASQAAAWHEMQRVRLTCFSHGHSPDFLGEEFTLEARGSWEITSGTGCALGRCSIEIFLCFLFKCSLRSTY